MRQLANKKAAENQAQAPGDQRRQHGEQRYQGDRLPRRLWNSSQGADGAIHDRRRGDDIATDDDHHHLHGERHQGPEVLSPLDGKFGGTLTKQKADTKDHHDSQQSKNQRIGKPALTPVGESQTKAD